MTLIRAKNREPPPASGRLRLGQVRADLGYLDSAVEALASAYMLEGKEIFEDEDPRYLELLADRIEL